MEVATDDNTEYRLPGYIAEGYDLNFIWDEKNGVVEVVNTTLETGYVHPSYGMVIANCYGVEYNADTKTFTFIVEYTVDAGTFGKFYETFTINEIYSAPVCRQQRAIANIELVDFGQ